MKAKTEKNKLNIKPQIMRHELNIARVEQDTTNWCWAACAQMVILYARNNRLTQTQIVAVMYDVSLSQVSVDNPDCNTPATVDEIEIVFQEYAISYEFLERALTYEELINELNTRPVEIGIRWERGGMHAVVAYGYNTNGKSVREVLIRDPSSDTAPTITVDYDDLINGHYRGRARGRWVDTFWKLERI